MQDAIGLINQMVQIKELNYIIKEFYLVPDNNRLYVGMQKADGVIVNWNYEDLLPHLAKHFKL